MKTTINGEYFKGHIDTVILKLLYEGDRYGYDIIKEIEQKSDGHYKVKPATLYSSLRRLEVQGFLRSYWGEKTSGGRKKYYTLTAMGKDVFARNQTDWKKSKDIISELVYGQDEVEDSSLNSINTDEIQNDTDSISEIEDDVSEIEDDVSDISAIEDDVCDTQTSLDSTENDLFEDETKIEKFFFDQSYAQTPKQAEEQLKDNFNRIFGKINSEKSYVDSMMGQSYKPDDKTEQSKHSFDFFDEDEQPFNQLSPSENDNPTNNNQINFFSPSTTSSLEKVEGDDFVFLEPQPTKSSQSETENSNEPAPKTDEEAIKIKARQILDEAKSQIPQATPPPPVQNQQKSQVEFIRYNSESNARVISDAEIIKRDYQHALSKLVKNIKRQPQTETINTRIQQGKKLENVRQETMRMGDVVTVRHHDNTVKQYNSENYYYKNRLMLVHHGVIFLFMLMQIVACFAVFELVIRQGREITSTDLQVYIGSVLLAVLLPIYAFMCSYKDYSKRKLREKTSPSSIAFRIIVLLQLWVIISAVNVYRGLITADIKDYLATFIFPAILSLNVVWSYIIHIALLNSNKFNV